MNIVEIRALSDEDLLNSLEDQKEAVFNLRFQAATSQLEDMNAIRRTRRDIARIKLVVRERELAAQQGNQPSAPREKSKKGGKK
ncbi:MAG: 50S ribosomal protein L29 [Burkholderiales bacterium]|nr:50S ribosomal protein L29 [Anaerolineae bacterium]